MILKTYCRVLVSDMSTTLPLFQRLVGREPDIHVTMGGWEIVALGDLLLMAGSEEALAPIRDLLGPLIVDDLAATQQLLEEEGAVITKAAEPGPTGTLLFARHPDGTHMEYIEWHPELVQKIISSGVR